MGMLSWVLNLFNFFSSWYGCSRTQNATHTRQNSHPLRSAEKCSCSTSKTTATSTATLSFTPAGCNTSSWPYRSDCSSQESTRISKETQWYTRVEKDSAWHEQYCKIKWAFSAIWYHHKHSGTLNTFIVWLCYCCLIQSTVEIMSLLCHKSVLTTLICNKKFLHLQSRFRIYHHGIAIFWTCWLC